MNKLARNATITLLSTGLLVGGVAVPAFASTPSGTSTAAPKTIAAIQAQAAIQIPKRITSLNKAIAKVDANKNISTSDRSTLDGTLNGDVTGLTALQAKIAADTDLKTAAKDFKSMYTTYRVYAVALPQATVVTGTDDATVRLTAANAKLAKYTGKNLSPANQATLADAKAKLVAAQSALSPVVAEALAVTPADYNSNKTVMQPIRTSLTTAKTDIKQAVTELRTIVSSARTKVGTGGHTKPSTSATTNP